jgi:hypothetical protein
MQAEARPHLERAGAMPPDVHLRVRYPLLCQPVCLIIDDPFPCQNLAYYEQWPDPHVRDIPVRFLRAFADLCAEYGVRGKFSVLPYPAGLGRIDQGLRGVPQEELQAWLEVCRREILPRFSIGPEILTHWYMLDLKTLRLTDCPEKVMEPRHTRESLAEYIAFGLEILKNVGLPATGVTSPGAFGRSIEPTYWRAIHDAVKLVTGSPVAWYFLHVDLNSPLVPPRAMLLDAQSGEGCVSIVSGSSDPLWRTQDPYNEPARIDEHITEDGQDGRLVRLFRGGGPIVWHTHWQSLFSDGRETGLTALREVFRRIREHMGERVIWMTAAELAGYTLASAAVTARIERAPDGYALRLENPFAGRLLTFTLATPQAATVREVRVDGRPLRRLAPAARVLEPQSWTRDADGISWACDLPAQQIVTVTLLDSAG